MKLASKWECTGCMACVDSCNHGVLDCIVDRDGYFAIKAINPSACTECGCCTCACPVVQDMKPSHETEPRPHAAWSNDDTTRADGASGGIFGALAQATIACGGIVYGAAIEGFDVRHKRVDSMDGIKALQGSKYQHSSLKGIYRLVRKDLQAGRMVLFCGLSCQVAGLHQFLGKAPKSRLYTLDTICGGLSTMLPMMSLKASGRYIGIKSFRDKEKGWRSTGFRYALKMVRTDSTTENLGLDNPVLNTFSSKLLKRSSCLDCKFNGRTRISDATIGDYWGDREFSDQHKKGLSVMILHNDRLLPIITEAQIILTPTPLHTIIEGNHNVDWTHYPLIRHMPMRRMALNAMRRGDFSKAQHYMSPGTFPGLLLRLYLKANAIMRKFSLKDR